MPQDSNHLIQLGITAWLVTNSSTLNLEVLRHGDLSRSANGSDSKTSRGVHAQNAIQHILLEQEACTGHRDTFKLACNQGHGYVLIEAFFGTTTLI